MSKVKQTINNAKAFRKEVLDWYDRHRRVLPWRALPREVPDPYHVWLSEVMLQQTTVGAVISYYNRFLELWPRVHDLAAAPSEQVMHEWAGLGYYARARNLHKCAQVVSDELGGVFPDTEDALLKLPGIGPYTAAAIAAIAFNKPATVVDGNIERVMARYHALEIPLPTAKPELKALAHSVFDGFEDRPGDLAQALMDLGAGVCIAKNPRCILCPLQESCEGRKAGIAADLPRREKKKARPHKYGDVYWIENAQGDVLFLKRPEKGLLGGMLALPSSSWVLESQELTAPLPLKGEVDLKQHVDHVFTHFSLTLNLKKAKLGQEALPESYFWVARDEVDSMGEGLPSLFKKALKLFV